MQVTSDRCEPPALPARVLGNAERTESVDGGIVVPHSAEHE
jgi:hypothetical protein